VSCYDDCILASFTAFAKDEVGHLIPDSKQCIDGVDVPIVILRDPAYPLLPLPMKPNTATGPLT